MPKENYEKPKITLVGENGRRIGESFLNKDVESIYESGPPKSGIKRRGVVAKRRIPKKKKRYK